MTRLPGFVRDDRGVTAVEYALYVFFVALGLFVAIGTFNGAIAGVLTSTADDPTISGPPPGGDQCDVAGEDESDDGDDDDGDGDDDDDGFLDDDDDSGDTGDDNECDDTEDDGDSEDDDSGDEDDED